MKPRLTAAVLMTRTDLAGQASAAMAGVAANAPHTANAADKKALARTLASNGHFRSIRMIPPGADSNVS
jgi:hypothetical protein